MRKQGTLKDRDQYAVPKELRMGRSLLKTPKQQLRSLGVLCHFKRVFGPPRANKPTSLNLRGASSGGDRKHSSRRFVPFPRGKPESPLEGGLAAGL